MLCQHNCKIIFIQYLQKCAYSVVGNKSFKSEICAIVKSWPPVSRLLMEVLITQKEEILLSFQSFLYLFQIALLQEDRFSLIKILVSFEMSRFGHSILLSSFFDMHYLLAISLEQKLHMVLPLFFKPWDASKLSGFTLTSISLKI